MTTDALNQRLQEAKEARRSLTIIELLILAIIIFLVGLFLGAYLFRDDQAGYWTNIITEGMGVFVTVVIIGLYARNEQQKRLIRQAGSVNHQIAINAVEELQENNWLAGSNGLLQNATLIKARLMDAKLQGANLSGANLGRANLSGALIYRVNMKNASLQDANLAGAELGVKLNGANLTGANLNRAIIHSSTDWEDTKLSGVNFSETTLLTGVNFSDKNMFRANLSNVNWIYTNLSGAYLGEANLNQAVLRVSDLSDCELPKASLKESFLNGSNLSRANLEKADLVGASLVDCNLTHANFSEVNWNETTILPDAKLDKVTKKPDKYWSEKTDMARYTNPDHPDFWQPDWTATGFDSYYAWEKAGKPKPRKSE